MRRLLVYLLVICTSVDGVLICDNGASVLTVDKDVQIYNPPPPPRAPVPYERPLPPPPPPPPAPPWTR